MKRQLSIYTPCGAKCFFGEQLSSACFFPLLPKLPRLGLRSLIFTGSTTLLLGSHPQEVEVQDGFVKPILTAASILKVKVLQPHGCMSEKVLPYMNNVLSLFSHLSLTNTPKVCVGYQIWFVMVCILPLGNSICLHQIQHDMLKVSANHLGSSCRPLSFCSH